MSKERRSIMGAMEYAQHTLKDIKKHMMDTESPRHEMMWAIGGLVVTIVANAIKIADEVFDESAKSEEMNAKQDLIQIKEKLNIFMDTLIGQD